MIISRFLARRKMRRAMRIRARMDPEEREMFLIGQRVRREEVKFGATIINVWTDAPGVRIRSNIEDVSIETGRTYLAALREINRKNGST